VSVLEAGLDVSVGNDQARSRIREAAAAVRAVLAEPDLRRAQVSWGAAWTGEWLMITALAVYAYQAAGVGAVAAMSVARMVPTALGVPFTSALADRYPRERVLVAVGLVRGLVVALGAGLIAMGSPALAVYVVAVAASVAFGPYMPTHAALMPLLCRTPGELTSANVVRGWIDSLSVLAGPLLAAVLVALTTVGGAMAVAALLSLASGLVLLGVRCEIPPRRQAAGDGPGMRSELAGGFAELRHNPQARTIVGLGAMQAFVRGALGVLTVVMALQLLHLGESGVGVLTAALGVGGVIGALAAGLLTDSRRLAGWYGGGIALWSAPLVVAGLWTNRATALTMLAVIGVANAVVDATAYTVLPRTVDDGVLGRVFGALQALIYATMALGAGAVPPLIRILGTERSMIAVGVFLPALVVLSWRQLRTIDRRIGARDREIKLLRGVSFLRPLPIAAMEYLSGGLQRAHVLAGQVVFRQGEPGDRYYVVAGGVAEVVRDGTRVAELFPGNGFGEMALLHDSPRAATIRAGSELDLWVLDRERFLTAVTRCSASVEAAASLTAQYLHASPRPAAAAVR
jgi:hypothetical protein